MQPQLEGFGNKRKDSFEPAKHRTLTGCRGHFTGDVLYCASGGMVHGWSITLLCAANPASAPVTCGGTAAVEQRLTYKKKNDQKLHIAPWGTTNTRISMMRGKS